MNDLDKAFDISDPIMFADDANLFDSHQNIKSFFDMVNCELQKMCESFRGNKLSLNKTKTNYTPLHKNPTKDKLPLKVPELKMGNNIIKRKPSLKLLGVIFEENIS